MTRTPDPYGFLDGLTLTDEQYEQELAYANEHYRCLALSALWSTIQTAADDDETPYPVTLLEIYGDRELCALDESGSMVVYTLFEEDDPQYGIYTWVKYRTLT